MTLAFGAAGPEVRQIQEFFNLLPTARARLNPDGRFGPLTQARVKEFQRANRLADDGIVGDLTMAAITEALRLLGLFPPPAPTIQAVRPINQQILGLDGTDNLIDQIIPSIMTIDIATFRPGSVANHPRFVPARSTSAGWVFSRQKKGTLSEPLFCFCPRQAHRTA